MALLKCKECGNEVSTKAKTCPKCGAKAPEKHSLSEAIAVWVVIIGFSIFGIHSCMHKTTPAEKAEQAKEDAEDAAVSAAHVCGDSIKEILNDPDSAKFDYDHTKYNTQTKGNTTTWDMRIPIHAKNAFNGTMPGVFECEIKKVGDSKPETQSITQIE